MVCEILTKPHPQYGHHSWYRHICAIGAVFNILMMMTANLVGFVVGTDGVLYMANQIIASAEGNNISILLRVSLHTKNHVSGFRFLIAACCCLFVGVQLMFEYRYVWIPFEPETMG